MTPHRGRQCLNLFFPATPSYRSQTLEGLFELTQRPSRALHHTWCIASRTSDRQGHGQVRCTRRGGCLEKKHTFKQWSLIVKSQLNRIELLTRPVHNKEGIAEKYSFKCDVCDKRFQRKDQLRSHARTHTGERPYACHICDKTFTSRVGLNNHMKIHESRCPTCNQKFHSEEDKINHVCIDMFGLE